MHPMMTSEGVDGLLGGASLRALVSECGLAVEIHLESLRETSNGHLGEEREASGVSDDMAGGTATLVSSSLAVPFSQITF